MIVIDGRNVNDIYDRCLSHLVEYGIEQPSRNGPVVTTPFPVVSVYQRPTERVLFDVQRDANPFFHFFESLWMLAGRDDASWLDTFVHDFSSRYAEPAGNLHGAYGYRWRRWFGYDQLHSVITKLRVNPMDRRVVITMWDPNSDSSQKDIPCNTHAYPRIIRPVPKQFGIDVNNPNLDGSDHTIMDTLNEGKGDSLDLTILCRSNDVIWGAYGANAVHFSFLLEYLAAQVGVAPGRLYQVSNNWHAYKATLDKVGWPHRAYADTPDDPYDMEIVRPYPLVSNADRWDEDLANFMAAPTAPAGYSNPFFPQVAVPLWLSHMLHKEGRYERAMIHAGTCQAEDWRLATRQWLERKEEKKRGKQ